MKKFEVLWDDDLKVLSSPNGLQCGHIVGFRIATLKMYGLSHPKIHYFPSKKKVFPCPSVYLEIKITKSYHTVTDIFR